MAESARRVLIVSASMGGGHDGAARELRRRLTAIGHVVETVDFLDLVECGIGRMLMLLYQFQLRAMPWSYELTYKIAWLLRRPATVVDTWLTRRKLTRCVRDFVPDVVVSVYPLSSLVLGRMRRKRLLRVPVVTYLTDFSVHPMWVDRGVDHHLAVSAATVGLAQQRGARNVVAHGPLVDPAFGMGSVDRAAVRASLGLTGRDRAVLVVAGSWGAGEVAATVAAIADGDRFRPVVVCGRNEGLRAELAARGAGIVIGWTNEMPALMASVDAVVENAGGLTCMEAFATGVPVVTYQPIPGHGRDNATTMAANRVTWYARDPDDLHAALTALTEPGPVRDELVTNAAALFVADPAGDVARIAGATARGRRGTVVPIGLRPLQRVAAITSLCVVSYAGLMFTGTEMSAHGIGVVKAPVAERASEVYLGVRIGDAALADPVWLDTLGVPLDPAGTTAPVGDQTAFSIVVDAGVARRHPGALARLARQVDVVNAGCGCSRNLPNWRSRADISGARRTLASSVGHDVTSFAPERRLNGFDYYYALRSHERLIRVDRVLAMSHPPVRFAPGGIYVIDARRATPQQLLTALDTLLAEAARSGFDVASFEALR